MSWRSRFAGFVKNRRGSIATEFAFVVPIAFLMLAAVVEFSAAFDADRRTSSAAGSLADIIARQDAVTERSVIDLLYATSALLQDTEIEHGTRVSSVALENKGQAGIVLWSFGEGMPRREPGSLFALSGITGGATQCPANTLILAEVTIRYRPVFHFILGDSPIKFEREAVFCPRTTSSSGVQLTKK